MQKNTNEYSFILQPSEYGVGVFATHDIAAGSHLRLFGDEESFNNRVRELPADEVPKEMQEYCIDRGGTLVCPPDFGIMPIGWYLNHSNIPNATIGNPDDPKSEYQWYALRDIYANEEIVIDYNSLDEPEESKDGYYFE